MVESVSLVEAINMLKAFEGSSEFRRCYRDTMLALVGIGIILGAVGGVLTYFLLVLLGMQKPEFAGFFAGIILLAIGFAIGDELGLRSSNCCLMLKKWRELVMGVSSLISNAFMEYLISINLEKMKDVLLGKSLPKRIRISISVLGFLLEELLIPLYSILEKIRDMDLEESKKNLVMLEATRCISSFERFDRLYNNIVRARGRGLRRSVIEDVRGNIENIKRILNIE